MNILAFDTCFDACSVAVDADRPGRERSVWYEQQLMGTGQAEALLPMIARVMTKAGLGYSDIDRIAVTHGPGTFTGTRIGIAAARALSLALGVPVVSFSSLLPIGMFATVRIPDCIGDRDAVIVARDARRDECYVEVVDTWGKSLAGPLLLAPDAAAALCPGYRLFAVGSAAGAVALAAREHGREIIAGLDEYFFPEHAQPDAAVLLGWAHAAVPSSLPLRPLYLRPPDAKPQDGKSIPRAAPDLGS